MRISNVYNEIQDLSCKKLKKSFKIGDIIKGRVIDVSEGLIILRTSDQQLINFAILKDKIIKKDSLVEIIITKITDDNIYAQFLETNSVEEASENEVINTLEKLGVSNAELNIDIFKTLIKYRQPINKDIFDYINYIIKAAEPFKNEYIGALKADVQSIVFMISKNIEITAENLHIYNEINSKGEFICGHVDKILKHLAGIKDPEIQSIRVRLNEVFLKAEEFSVDNMNAKSKKLINLLAQLESSLEAKDKNNYEIRETLMGLRNTLNLLKSINDYMNYVQIPIIINNKKTDVKIFVYEKGKRNKNIDPTNANILICLNTSNLGYIETYIEMRSNDVNITFKSEDTMAANTINYHREILKEALELKGYDINIRAIERKHGKADFDFMEEALNTKEISRYSIDVRI